MKETVKTLILKDEEAVRSYARSVPHDSVKELIDELWNDIRAANFCGGQPRSQASIDGVMLARLGLSVADCSNDEFLKAEAWSMMAYTLNANEDYTECLTFYARCIESFEKIGQHARAARTRLGYMTALSMVGQHDEAIRIGLIANDWFQQNGDSLRHARFCVNLATVYQRLDRHEEAIQSVKKAVGIFAQLGDEQALAQCYLTLGNSLCTQGRFAESEEMYAMSEEISERLAINDLMVQSKYNKAYVRQLRGNYSEAFVSFEESRKIFTKHQSLRHLALCDLDESEILLHLNLPQEASHAAEKAIESFRLQSMRYEQAKATVFFAVALTQNRQFGDALHAFRNAKVLFSEEGNTYWMALIDLYRAEVLFSLGRYWESDSIAKSAEKQFAKLQRPTNQAITLVLLARVAMQLGRLEDAQFFADSILDLMREHKMPLLGFPCYALCAEIAEKAGDSKRANRLYEQAVQESENKHTGVDHDELRIAFFKRKREVYESLVRFSLASAPSDVIAAFEWCERAKAAELVDLLVHHFPSVRGRADQALVNRVTRIREELNGSYLRSRPEVSDLSIIPDAAGIQLKEDELVRSLHEMSEADPEYVSLQSVDVADLASLQESLPSGTQILQFFTMAEEVIAFIVGKTSIHVVRHLIPISRANFLIARLRTQLGRFETHIRTNNGPLRAADTAGTLTSLFQELFAALIPFLTEQHLIIVPDGPLYLLPFHALFDGTSYLGDRYEVSYAPSSSVFKQNRGRKAVSSEERIRVSETATRAGFFDGSAEADSIHIETEIVYRPQRPLFSCFKMADEPVTALDLFSRFCECNISVLLGKVTGIEAASSGEDFQAMVRAFLYAGSRSVLLGLWTTHQESTEKLIGHFYEQWRAGQTKSAALKSAVEQLRTEFPHPFYWAPFVLFGQF
jgi:CHAT domain-containing protein/tetratricopeptide (TPR) repeat protein